MSPLPVLADVVQAAERLHGLIHPTPLLKNQSISQSAGFEVFLKCENLQRTGSFKIRGALNALLQIPQDHRAAGVVAYSSGNHAQAVALAARLTGMPATIVMPENSVQAKVAATQGYGARVVQKGVDGKNRRTIAEQIAAEIRRDDHPAVRSPTHHRGRRNR